MNGWRKSSFSNPSGNSIEVRTAKQGPRVEIRESDDPDRVVVTTREKFRSFRKGVKDGEFDDV